MGKTSSVIEINGNRYDAATGQIINAIEKVNRVKNQVIDGFTKASAIPAPALSQEPKINAHGLHKRTEKAQTLRRDGLRKPAGPPGSRLQHLSTTPRLATQLRAKQTPKHTKVSRFGVPTAKAQPAARPLQGEIINHSKPAAHHQQSATAAPLPSLVTSVSHQRLERLLDAALLQADAHKQALKYQAARHFWQKPRFFGRHRLLGLAIVVIAAAAVVTVLAWRQVPALSVRLAAHRAHVAASLPAYQPAGYHLISPVATQGDAVTLKYQSAEDKTVNFAITQQRSDLTSAALAHTMIPDGMPVQTSQIQGNTVYIYGADNNAAWVNNGILYTITDHANLPSNEVLKIVESIN